MATFSVDFLSEDDFEVILAIFSCYYYGANAFWGSWEDRYGWKRLSQMLLVQSVTVKKVGY